jgi:hypothetical protein
MSKESLIAVQNLLGDEAQGFVIICILKIIHLPGVSVVRKGRCSSICVLESIFASNGTNAHQIHNKCPKTVNKHGTKFHC